MSERLEEENPLSSSSDAELSILPGVVCALYLELSVNAAASHLEVGVWMHSVGSLRRSCFVKFTEIEVMYLGSIAV
jgi:hypothetical protein